MFPIITPVMLNMPDLVQGSSLTRLPWPDGSVISARLAPSDVPGNALLILGSYRLLAQVPPATPMGDVWLMLINRQMPARFTLLSDVQVLQMLAGMLEGDQAQAARQAQRGQGGAHAALMAGESADWPDLINPQRGDGRSGLPWNSEASSDGNTLLWYDQQDGQPRGMLHRQVDGQSFSLSGRIDLDRLGGISFTLKGAIPKHAQQAQEAGAPVPAHGWSLDIHTETEAGMKQLRRDFAGWMDEHSEQFPGISAEINTGLPETGSGSLTGRMA